MAHSCPECGSTCYCCGDIDDIDFGESEPGCTCCLDKWDDDEDNYDDYDDRDDEPAADDKRTL